MNNASVLFAESITSLYPILIKSVNTNLFTQVLVRLLTISIISSIFISKHLIHYISEPKFYAISLLQVFHIFISYVGFSNLDAGTAMTIFYTYPIMNVILQSFINNQPINMNIIVQLLIAFVGTIIISYPHMNNLAANNGIFIIGLVAMFISAFTESLTYTFYKAENQTNPFDSLFTLYFIGTIFMVILSLIMHKSVDTNINNISKLVLFNIFIGLFAFVLLFYGIPRVSVEMFSALSFIGIISAYIFGYYFLNEQITGYHILGTILILFSIFNVHKLNK